MSSRKLLFVALLIGSAAALPARESGPDGSHDRAARDQASRPLPPGRRYCSLPAGSRRSASCRCLQTSRSPRSPMAGCSIRRPVNCEPSRFAPSSKNRPAQRRSMFRFARGSRARRSRPSGTRHTLRSRPPTSSTSCRSRAPARQDRIRTRASVTRTRQEFFGASDPLLTHADPRPLVLAAYYPWFGPATTAARSSPTVRSMSGTPWPTRASFR